MIRDLMVVERPAGTHLSKSSIPGSLNGLARDDDNALVTHANLIPAQGAAIKAAAVVLTAGVALGVGAMKAAPHIKSRLSDLKSKLNRRTHDAGEADAQEVELAQPDVIWLRAV